MSDESGISVEETNKIRLQLGLKPIVVSNQQASKTNDSSLSIDETNKLRLSLGLKSIVPETSQAQTTEQYQQKTQSSEKDEVMKEKLDALKQKAIRRKKVNVIKSLGEEDEGADEGTDDWLSRIKGPEQVDEPNKKHFKKKSSKEHTVQGIKVGHGRHEFESTDGDVILTLKDRSVLDDDGEKIDELESNELIKKKKLKRELAQQVRSRTLDGNGSERGFNERYHDEGGERDSDHFVLTGNTLKVADTNPVKDESEKLEKQKLRKVKFSLDLEDDNEENDRDERSDYAKAKPIKMKKIKKNTKSSLKRQRRIDEDDDRDVNIMNVDLKNEDLDLQDDLELRSMLSLKRIQNLKKRKKLSPEELALEIKEDENDRMDVDNYHDGLIIDENDEFLSSIRKSEEPLPLETKEDEIVTPEELNPEDLNRVNGGKSMNDVADNRLEPVPEPEPSNVNFDGGLASTLSFLKSRNVVREKPLEAIQNEREAIKLKKEADLNKLRLEISKRIHKESLEADSNLGKLSSKQREMFIEKELEQFKSLQTPESINDKLKNYKPEIKLKYIDELGREMSTKEAYKHLSHQFHGKAPNKSKIEKKLKTFEKERQLLENSKLLD